MKCTFHFPTLTSSFAISPEITSFEQKETCLTLKEVIRVKMALLGDSPEVEVCPPPRGNPVLSEWVVLRYLFLPGLFTFLYKALLLPSPTAHLVVDVVMPLLSLGTEGTGLLFGTKGDLCH